MSNKASLNKINDGERLLKSILDSSFTGIMTFNSVRDSNNEIIDFELIFANDIAASIIGEIPDDLISKKLHEIMPETREEGFFEKLLKVVDSGNPLSIERHFTLGESKKWFRLSAVKFKDGITVTFQDITDLKESITRQKQTGRKYQQLFEESLDAIFITQENFDISDINDSFIRLFGYKHEEVICMNLSVLFHNQDDFELLSRKVLDSGVIEGEEIIFRTKEGARKTGLLNCVASSNEGNVEITYLGVIKDITKKKQTDQRLIRAEKLTVTGKIARTIAHEVRNPLTNLSLALNQLRDEITSSTSDTEMYLDIIERNSSRISKLIDDLLHSAKPRELKLEQRSVNNTIREALNLVKDRLKLKEMKLTEKYGTDLGDVMLDDDQFKVALLNLFVNATEAMEPSKGKLEIITEQQEESIRITIRDNGKGISEENMKSLFEPYFTSKKDGTGLGLTMVENIISSHNGEIEAESEEGNGTTFVIQLPVV